MTDLAANLRHTIRSLRTSPGLVIVCVLSLGLGLGVNLTLFTAIDAVFFYEPTVADRSRVVSVQPGNSNQFSYLNYRDLHDSGIFESVAGYRRAGLTVRIGALPEAMSGVAVTPNFFEFIGVPAARGRQFSEREAMPDRQPRVAVLSHPFWIRRFGGDEGIIGRELIINGESFAVIGVMPKVRPVTMLQDPDVYVPISRLVLPTVDNRNNGNALAVLGRLRPDATPARARDAVTALDRRLEAVYPADNRGMGQQPATILPLRGGDLAGSSAQLIAPAILFSLFGLVLLSACANVAGLLLARSSGRQREIAVRFVLGARRSQVVGLLLTESFGLATLGIAAGALVAIWLTRVLNTLSFPTEGPIALALAPSPSLALYAIALLVSTGLLCGIAPALRLTRANTAAVMHGSGGQNVTGRLRLRHAFVAAQVAACLILLVLSSLMLRSLARVATMDTGFQIDRGLVASVRVDAQRYADDGGLALGERLAERLASIAGVESVSFANILPLGTDLSATRLYVSGTSGDPGPRTYVNSVAPRYFSTLGIPFVRGRDFEPSERQGTPQVAIVTESFERAYFQGQTALGRYVRRSNDEPYFEIVGVVRDHMYGTYGDSSTPIFYSSYLQRPRVSTQVRPIVAHIRTSAPPSAALSQQVSEAIAGIDSTVVADVRTLRDATSSEPSIRRFGSRLLVAAGALGLLLAMIGLYGMMAFVVATRTSEIGVRMALGAGATQILGAVLGQGMRLVGTGLAIGTVVSLLLAQAARGLLAGLSPADPIAFGGTAALLAIVAIVACYVPAKRAARVDPLVALRRL
ncbi:MAG TPA: ABC transporter permease [Vicinamibacterales bacterium]|jgi:predicted permease